MIFWFVCLLVIMMIHDENHNFQFSGQKVTVSSFLTQPSQFVNLTIGLSGKPLFYFVFSPIAFVRTFIDNIMKYYYGGGWWEFKGRVS